MEGCFRLIKISASCPYLVSLPNDKIKFYTHKQSSLSHLLMVN